MKANSLYVLFLVVTLLVPIGAMHLMQRYDDDVVCEMLEDLAEEEEGDDTEEVNFGENDQLKHYPGGIELLHETRTKQRSNFGQKIILAKDISIENNTPPPELI